MFVFSPMLFCPFIHVSSTCTSALSPGCSNLSANKFVVIMLFPKSVHPGLSVATNFNPAGI